MSQKLFKLKSNFKPAGDQGQAILKLSKGLKEGLRYQTLLGVTGSGKTFTMANVIEKFNKPTLVMAPNKALAAQLYREYKNFFPNNAVHYFVSYYDYYQPEAYMAASDTYIEKEAMINQEIDRLRHAATSALSSRQDVIIVASVSCIYNLGAPETYSASALVLSAGQTLVRSDLISQLVKIHFERNDTVLARGQFRVRGDVIEIRPMAEDIIYHIELAEQKVKSLSVIDNLTRHNLEDLKELMIFPPKHFISSTPQITEAIKSIKLELKDRLAYFKKNKLYLEEERLARRTKYDIEMMRSLGYCHGIENYSRHLSGKLPGEAPDSLLSYFPKDFLTIIDESHIGVPQVGGMYFGDKARKESLIQYGWRLPSALDNRPLRFPEFEKLLGPVIFSSATPGDYEKKHAQQVVEQIIRPTGLIDPEIEVRPVFDKEKNYSQIDDIIKESLVVVKNNGRVIINTLTKKQAEDLDVFLQKQGIKSTYLHSDIKTFERTEILKNFRLGIFDVLVGVNLLREGLDLPEVVLVAILDADREGFLRSTTSLIQIMGRAARNVSGKIILYADRETGSIARALAEAKRRRIKQLAYNKKYKIDPKTIYKKIEDFLDVVQK